MHKPRFSRALLLASLAIALSGCMAGRNYREPVPEAPALWHAPLPHGGQVQAMADWWEQFNDPTLNQLVQLAEADSPSLLKAWANIGKARATLQSTRAGALPSVNASGSVSRGDQVSQQGSATSAGVIESRSSGLDASWEIDLFGKVRRGAEAARARIEARVDNWHDARVSLGAEVADTYVQYRSCGLLADAYESSLTSMTHTQIATQQLVDAGFKPPAEGALARASLASTRSTLLSQRAECDLLVKSLVNLTGTDEETLRALLAQSTDAVPQPALLSVRSVPADVLRQRPDLAATERELAAASAEIGVAQADLYPSLSLSGSLTISASDLVPSATSWSFGPSISIPLFDGGRRLAAVDTARANYSSALADYRQGVRDAVEEVERALVNLDSTAQRAEQAEQADEEYRRYFLATEASWRAGRESLITLEEARRSALSAEIQRITLQRDRVSYWIALYKALGGGWQPGDAAKAPTSEAVSLLSSTHQWGAV